MFLLFFILLTLVLMKGECEKSCATPAIPYGAHLSSSSGQWLPPELRYAHNYTVYFRCLTEENELIGGFTRTCRDGQWDGPIPRCANEMGIKVSIFKTGIIDDNGYQENPILDTFRKEHAFEASSYILREGCISANISSYQRWELFISNNYHTIQYFKLAFYHENSDGQLLFNRLKAKAFMGSPGTYRSPPYNISTCYEPIINVDPVLEVTYMRFLCEQSDIKKRLLSPTVINVHLEPIGEKIPGKLFLCQVRLFTLPTSCGTPDRPLNGDMTYRNEPYPTFTYKCDPQYLPRSITHVTCNTNIGKWIQPVESPICEPIASCKLNDIESDPNLIVEYRNQGTNDDRNSTPINTIAILKCSDEKRLIGSSIRYCNYDGKWSANEAKCVDSYLTDTPSSTSSTFSGWVVYIGIGVGLLLLLILVLIIYLVIRIIKKPQPSQTKDSSITLEQHSSIDRNEEYYSRVNYDEGLNYEEKRESDQRPYELIHSIPGRYVYPNIDMSTDKSKNNYLEIIK